MSLPLGLVSPGIYGALMKVSPKRLVPEAGCACDWPRRENGSAFSAELLPVQKMAPCGWPGLKPRKLRIPPLPPNPPPPNRLRRSRRQSRPALQIHRRQTSRPLPREIPFAAAILRAQCLDRIAQPVHIHPGQRAHRARLAADRHRIFAEVGVAGDRGQCRAAHARLAALRLNTRLQRARQVQVLRAVARQLPDGLFRLRRLPLLLPLLRCRARGQHQARNSPSDRDWRR